MVNSLKYWENREKSHADIQIFKDEEVVKQIEKNYQAALDDINERINIFYERYAGSEGISIEEAQKRVSEMDVKAYQKTAKKAVSDARKMEKELKRKLTKADFPKELNDELKLYNATMRINRLEMLKAEMNLELAKATSQNQALIDERLYMTGYEEYKRQAGILGEMIPSNPKQVDNLLKSSIMTAGQVERAPWSQTLWTNHEAMAMELNVIIRRAITQGVNAETAAARIADRFGKETTNARRLLVTETAYVQGLVQRDCFKRAGFDRYVYLAESRACKVCQKLDGKDFLVDDAKIGENYYPMHPYCKCSSAPFMSEDEFEKLFEKNELVDEISASHKRMMELEKLMAPFEDGDFGNYSEDEAEEVYSIWSAEMRSLLKKIDSLLKKNDEKFRKLKKDEILQFFTEKINHEIWKSSLSEKKREVITNYSGSHFAEYNKLFRRGEQAFRDEYKRLSFIEEEWIEKMINEAYTLEKAIDGYEIQESFVSYRGLSFDFNYLKPGQKTVIDRGFMSTSPSKTEAENFARGNHPTLFKINVNAGSKVGAYIEELSTHSGEKEFLIKPGTEFKVLNKTKELVDGNRVIDVIELEVN